MNLDSLSLALAGICNSVANLTKKNSKQSITEINHVEPLPAGNAYPTELKYGHCPQLVSQHGAEAERHLFRCLFSHVDFSGDGKSSGKDFHQTQLLIQEFGTLFTKPNFVSILCFALDNPLQHQKSLEPSPHLFTQLSKVLKLNRVQEVVFGLVLLQSTRSDTRTYAAQFIKQKLPDLLRSYVDADTPSHQEGGLLDTSVEVLHVLLSHLVPDKDHFGIGADQKKAFIDTLRRDFPRDRVPAVLSPLLYPETDDIPTEKLLDISTVPKSIMGTSLADIMAEAGCSCTATVAECRNILRSFAGDELTPKNVARTLGMMARNPNGVSEQHGQAPSSHSEKDNPGVNIWNVEHFVQAVREEICRQNPKFSWRDVVAHLDHPGFLIPNKKSLKLLMVALFHGLPEGFPVELIYRQWNNTEGQLSFIVQCINNPDVFSFADHPGDPVVFDILKSAPNEDDRDVATWKSLSLVECLLRLTDTGNYPQVLEIFKVPVQKCPDLLVLALLQTPPTWNTLKQELISNLMPIFLGSHANSAIVLHYAWHHQGHSSTIRTLIMHAMAEWYMRGEPHDQTRLSRILDVAQDLKALSMLLNATPFAFVIDLACLASRREYLKLDKWLSDKIQEHKEPFIQGCVNFLKRRCPQLMGAKDELPQIKSQQLPLDTITTMLNCLKTSCSGVSQELSETVSTMYNNANAFIKSRMTPGVVGTPVGTPSSAAPSSYPGSLAANVMPHGKAPNYPTNPMVNSLDALGGIGHPGPAPSGSSSFSQGLPGPLGSAPPSSPSKGYPVMSQPSAPGPPGPPVSGPPLPPGPPAPFGNHLQSITSQFQSMGMQSTVTSAIGQQRNPVNSLAVLSAQVAAKQPTPPSSGGGRTASSGDMSSIFPEMTQQFPKEVEDKANSYFQQIFNQPPHPTMTINEVLDMLKRFKESNIKMEKDVFACMLRNLFEEYRFFPQYPERELMTTAVLFGGIIEQGIVTYWTLGIALRYILEALRKPPNSKMYYFGITALDRFKTKLKDYPQYCQHLAAINHFSNFPPHLIEFIDFGSRSMEPPQGTATSGSVTPTMVGMNVSGSLPGNPTPRSVSTPMEAGAASAPTSAPVPTSTAPTRALPAGGKPSIATATNIDTLLAGQTKEEISIPLEALQDKVFFIFNNLSLANMNQKAGELKEQMEDFVPWVAQYLVMKRASIEPNFHTLYSSFIDVLNISAFTIMVVKETFRNIKVLLRSDKGVANFSDRTLLKNLGHWLGMLTLAKNKPILQIDIDIKGLLYEAYSKGSQELLYVVPFTAKVLESASKSKVFRPPNPWTMAIMNVLAELHQEQDLKLNLKFEIEVLCKTLGLNIETLDATTYLKDTTRMHMIEPQLSAQGKVVTVPTPPQPEDVAAPPPVPPVPTVPMVPPPMPASTPSLPPQPLFSYDAINVSNISNIAPHILINEQNAFFSQHPQLKTLVRPAIERAITELIQPVVDRSIKIALTTCEQIIKKDFALDPNEDRMSAAAHCMIRNIAAGLALITCREPLYMTIGNNLKNSFASHFRNGLPPALKPMLEEAANNVALDNTELACVFIQKTAVERGIPEIDKRLSSEFDLRKLARAENRRYCDPSVLTYHAERMPEQIQLKVGTLSMQQLAVYDEYARNIPGFIPMSEGLPFGISKPQPQPSPQLPPQAPPRPPPQQPQPQQPQMFHSEELANTYDRLMHDIETSLGLQNIPPTSPLGSQFHSLMDAIMKARSTCESRSAGVLVQKAVGGILDQYAITGMGTEELMRRFKDCHLMVLKALGDTYGPPWVKDQVTKCLTRCRDEYKFNVEGMSMLIRSGFVQLQQYDLHLVTLMENGLNQMAVSHISQLLTQLFLEDKAQGAISDADFPNSVEALQSLGSRRQPYEGLSGLVESMRPSSEQGLNDRGVPLGPTTMMQSGIAQAREFDDPPGLHEKTEYLLREWVNMYHSPAAGRDSTKAFSAFVQQMHQQGILKTDDLITRFFRLCTEMCVDLCYRALNETSQSPTLVRAKCFHTLDAFVRLIALLVKHSGDTSNTVTKINLLNKVLGIVAGVLLQDHEVRYTDFQQLPYHRIFIMLFIELNAPEPILETINFQVLSAFCHVFHVLRPAKAPGFAYAWLELVSHRVFIGRLLALTPQQRGWGLYGQLLIDLFKFLAPFLRNAELSKPAQLLYKGTLRVLLVLLHDFPEFLCEYHYSFCDVIPPNCIQMRNLILSAFPRNMRLPDPFTPNLKVDSLPDIAVAPRIVTTYANTIQPASFKKDLESYLKTRSPITFLSELRSNLQSTEAGCHYNIPLINALVLYVGTQAIQLVHNKGQTPNMGTIAPSSHMDIFQNLAVNLDTEGRYLFLTAIANQLRYPNSHTHYFSCTLLYLFAQANTETIQEQITRVLLERLIVNRPHPWGLLITFIELIKNPSYKFWTHDFVHCAPEIHKLFESVARSCMHTKQNSLREPETPESHH